MKIFANPVYSSRTCGRPELEPNGKIWRYMNIYKFKDLIDTNSLYFTRCDYFQKDDSLEGKYTNTFQKRFPHIQNPDLTEIFINCWHINENQNSQMWDNYGADGVALLSNYQSLMDSFTDDVYSFYSATDPIRAVRVKYYDFKTQATRNLPYLNKHVDFLHERELRVIISENQGSIKNFIKPKVDIKTLIKAVYINPKTRTDLYQEISKICSKYSLVIGNKN
jgi:hypothetical protein